MYGLQPYEKDWQHVHVHKYTYMYTHTHPHTHIHSFIHTQSHAHFSLWFRSPSSHMQLLLLILTPNHRHILISILSSLQFSLMALSYLIHVSDHSSSNRLHWVQVISQCRGNCLPSAGCSGSQESTQRRSTMTVLTCTQTSNTGLDQFATYLTSTYSGLLSSLTL